MKRSILVLAAVFTFSSFFISCRETNRESDDVEIYEDEIEDAVDDTGDAIEEGANEVEEEIEGTDDY